MRVSLDIPMTERENAIGLLALTDQPLSVSVRVDTQRYATPKKRAPKEPGGPYSEYWFVLKGLKSVDTWPDFQEVLDCAQEHVWERLHVEFATDTMSTVGPRQFEKWVRDNGMSEGIITLSKNAEMEAVKRMEAKAAKT